MDQVLPALERLPYLEVVGTSSDGDIRRMVQVRLESRQRHCFKSEAIKSDVLGIWQLGVPASDKGVYRIADTIGGFDFRFALYYETGDFVTGAFDVRFPVDIE